MPRQKKDGININYFIRRDVKEKLDAYCEDVGQTATMAIERILDDYLTKYMADKENAPEGENKADSVPKLTRPLRLQRHRLKSTKN